MEKLNVFLHNGTKVGKFERNETGFTFKYEKNFKGPEFLIFLKADTPPTIKEGRIVVDYHFEYSRDQLFFPEITNNFPEGHTLSEFVKTFDFSPHDDPLRFLSIVGSINFFKFVEEKNG